ncbi:putative DNA replication and repair protein RecO [Magnetofaba australis IT-1]|uniref:Putative DNA replication and repair protein RecO n=1 Tax=Magnetofaba australis IT-1 TaxID=1434232 RepID=A0A1Y2K4K0_9PROT|nr:putative DNA replication and repair protein RecO [Magnetofaba australis IT-1]
MFLSARRAEALATLQQAEIDAARHRLWRDARAGAAAQVMLEQVWRQVGEGDPHPRLFDDLDMALARLDAGVDPLTVLAIWQGRLLRALGFGWRADRCVGCGAEASLAFFSLKRNQTVCQSCGAPYADRLLQLDPGAQLLMRNLPWPLAPEAHAGDDVAPSGIGLAAQNLYDVGALLLQRHGRRPTRARGLFHDLLTAPQAAHGRAVLGPVDEESSHGG